MTLYNFKVLVINERMEAVDQHGTFEDNYVIKNVKINCYAKDRIFVDVHSAAEQNTTNND